MAIKYLNSINLNENELQYAVIQNLGTVPATATKGQIYYDTNTNKLQLRTASAWVPILSGTDTNTTYTLATAPSGTAIRLTGSDSTTNDVTLTGAGTVVVTRTSANTLTITGTDSAAGTVTSVAAGTGISVTGTPSVTPTVNILYAGASNAILAATAATPLGEDTLWFSDATDSTIKKALISSFPGFGADGTVTNVATANSTFISGSGGPITTTGSLTYSLSATGTPSASTYLRGDNTWAAVAGYSGWTVGASTGVAQLVSSGATASFLAGSGITTTVAANAGNPTVTIVNTGVLALTAGTNISITGTSANYTINSTDQYQGTVTSITLAAGSGTGTAITSSGTFTFAGGTGITTSVTGTTVTINASNLGTVTSVATGTGLTGGTITGSGTVSVLYTGASNIVNVATAATGLAADSIFIHKVATGNASKALISGITLNQFGAPTADLSIGTFKLTNVVNPTAAQDAATKNYVDTTFAGSGALIYQGGYNASTNVPNLDNTPVITINKGFTYTVTVDGTFFTEQVRVGDLLIANINTPLVLADWTRVQSNIDLATTTTVGIASFAAASFAVSGAGEVTIKAGGVILGTQTTGAYNPTVGLNTTYSGGNFGSSGVNIFKNVVLTNGVITGYTNEYIQSSTTVNPGVILIATDVEATAGTVTTKAVTPAQLISNATTIVTSREYKSDLPLATTVAVINHNLNSVDVMVQLYDAITFETVYADVVRTDANNVTVTFGAAPTNKIRILIIKIG